MWGGVYHMSASSQDVYHMSASSQDDPSIPITPRPASSSSTVEVTGEPPRNFCNLKECTCCDDVSTATGSECIRIECTCCDRTWEYCSTGPDRQRRERCQRWCMHGCLSSVQRWRMAFAWAVGLGCGKLAIEERIRGSASTYTELAGCEGPIPRKLKALHHHAMIMPWWGPRESDLFPNSVCTNGPKMALKMRPFNKMGYSLAFFHLQQPFDTNVAWMCHWIG